MASWRCHIPQLIQTLITAQGNQAIFIITKISHKTLTSMSMAKTILL